jgi:hypothetical protein
MSKNIVDIALPYPFPPFPPHSHLSIRHYWTRVPFHGTRPSETRFALGFTGQADSTVNSLRVISHRPAFALRLRRGRPTPVKWSPLANFTGQAQTVRIAWSYMETQMIKNKLACFLSTGLSISPNAAALGTPRCGGSSDPSRSNPFSLWPLCL